MADDLTTPESKLTRSKQQWATEHKFITGQTPRGTTSGYRQASTWYETGRCSTLVGSPTLRPNDGR